MIEVKGKGCISAKIIADSISENGRRITTFELEYNRFIHSELMTHRLLSRNAMSSRAVPIEKTIDQVRNNPAMPIHWGKNQRGMRADEECDNKIGMYSKEEWWKLSALSAARFAEEFKDADYAKQIVNRILEPFQIMKTVVTATEWDNFFYLRCHTDAQPEIKELAGCMYQAREQSVPKKLKAKQWHLPYVQTAECMDTGLQYYFTGVPFESDEINLEDAQKVSASCCAQVSYRLLDDSLDKAIMIYDRLVESKPVHASPFEHQASPLVFPTDDACGFEEGTTHSDFKRNCWSGNFKGWVQYRQLIKDNVCDKYEHNATT
jgi:thymidylate synthase ThyX